jgi:hypothetical protein
VKYLHKLVLAAPKPSLLYKEKGERGRGRKFEAFVLNFKHCKL